MDNLFEEFESSTYDDWKEVALKSMKGKPFEDLLTVENGMVIEPFYNHENAVISSAVQAPNDDNSWWVVEEFNAPEAEVMNKQILSALMRGVNAIKIPSNIDFNIALKDVLLEHVLLLVSCRENKLRVAKKLHQYLIDSGQQNIAVKGVLLGADAGAAEEMIELADYTLTNLVGFCCFDICFDSVLNIDNQYLVLSNINEYFNLLSGKFSVEEIGCLINYSHKNNTNFFLDIAFLRSLKNVCNFLAKQYDSKSNFIPHIYSETALPESSEKDYKNMLRSTTQCMSSILGGTNAILIQTFDQSEDEFAKRIARNVQLILGEEAYLNRVQDPTAGSYFVETLTHTLEKRCWENFKALENKGGYWKNFKSIESHA